MGIGIDFSDGLAGSTVDTGNPAAILSYPGLVATSTTETSSSLPGGITPSGVTPSVGTPSAVTPSAQSTIGGILSAIGGAIAPSSSPVVGSGYPNQTTVSQPVAAPNPFASPVVWLGILVIAGGLAFVLLNKKK